MTLGLIELNKSFVEVTYAKMIVYIGKNLCAGIQGFTTHQTTIKSSKR